MMDFFEFVVVGIVAGASLLGVRMLAQTSSRSAYRDALRLKDEMIRDLKSQVNSWKGKASAAIAPPYGAEASIDVIEKAIPKWARPFAKPLMEWASTDEGRATIDGLIKKYAKIPAGGEAQTDDKGV